MGDLKDKVSTAIDNAAKLTKKTTHVVVDKSKAAVHESTAVQDDFRALARGV